MSPPTPLDDAIRAAHAATPASPERIAALDRLRSAADAQLHSDVQQARTNGVTWATIGAALGVTRQAAYQRFGGPTPHAKGPRLMTQHTLLTDSPAHAATLIRAYADGDLDTLRARFGTELDAQLTADTLRSVWHDLVASFGQLEGIGDATALAAGEHVVTDARVDFEAGSVVCRMAWAADGTLAGLFFVPVTE